MYDYVIVRFITHREVIYEIIMYIYSNRCTIKFPPYLFIGMIFDKVIPQTETNYISTNRFNRIIPCLVII